MKKLIVFGSILLWSCSSQSEKSTTHDQEAETRAAHHHDESSETIELNNGEKWVVNEEMKPFVRTGSELVNAYIQEDQSDYKVLAEQLKDQNNQLIKSCTMKGKSHDELHKWLHAHLELVKKLEKQADAAKASGIVLQLKNSYQEYHQYFK